MKQRKRGIRRMFAGVMAVLMMLSAADVSGWGVMNAKAEETTTGKVPQILSIMDESQQFIIIMNGKLQDDKVSGNANTLYEGTNWHYDSEKNQLVLQNASVQDITVEGGDLTVLLSGENTLSGEIKFNVDGGSNTLEINGGSDNGSLIGNGEITVGVNSEQTNNLKITGATTETVDIECNGDLTIEKSHIVACVDRYQSVLSGNRVSITDSYVKAKCTENTANPILSQNGITILGSQILAETGKLFGENDVIQNVDSSNTVITKKWKDYETGVDATKTSVYGKATLKEALMIASGESIEFESGASITNLEKLTLEDGASLFVNGEEHIHNKDGDVTYTWKDDKEHIKNVACKDCPIGYVTKEMEPHSIGENGFCACDNVCQPAVLTTNKYDIDGDSTKDTVYEISNAGQLYWFAGLVNGTLDGVKQNTSANAILTANITANENLLDSLQYDAEGNVSNGSDFISWTPIADCMGDIIGYSGTFDGNNKTVSGLYFNGNSPRIGLFGSSEADSNIKNVGVVDSYFKGNEFVGGVCGRNEGTITNCYNTGNLTAIDPTAAIGGICGINDNGGTIANCYNTGTVTATGSTASVGGVCGSSLAPISNCYNIGTVTATSSGADISSICGFNFGPVTNCYYLADTEDENGSKTAAQFANGEVDYLLSQGCSTGEGDNTVTYDGSIWGQTIGTDTYPTLGGAKVYKNATYNGCEGKPGEPVSYEYSNTEKNTYGDHPDTDNDGKCDDCDQYIDGIGAKLAGYSLSLTGNIGVNFYMELSDQIIADKGAYMQFTLPNGTVTKVPVSDAQTNTEIKEGTTYYRFPCEVSSYEMTQDIKAQMFDGNGKCGKEYTYTVRDYAQYIIKNYSSYVDAYPFAVAMLNYGASSQKYFNKAVDDLANKNLSSYDQEIPNLFNGYINGFVAKKAENGVLGQFAGFSMVLKSETTLNLFYEPKEGIDVSKLTFSVDGKEITPVKRGQYYILSLENIRANELGNSKTFTVTDGTNTLSGDYCAMMYCYQVLQAAKGAYADDLVTLVKAFSDYAYTAQSVCKSN